MYTSFRKLRGSTKNNVYRRCLFDKMLSIQIKSKFITISSFYIK